MSFYSINSITLLGSIIQKPELRYTPGGLAIGTLNLAGNQSVTGSDGLVRKIPWYHRVSVFGKLAESLTESLDVGAILLVHGMLNYRTWEAQEGGKRSSVDINARTVQLMSMPDATFAEDQKGNKRLESGMNQVIVLGNATRDPELKHTTNGHAVLRVGLAVNERRQGKNGEWEETVHFLDINAWNELAEAASHSIQRGAPVLATGMFQTTSWDDKDGNRRYGAQIDADRIESGLRLGAAPTSSSRPARPTSSSRAPDIDEEFPPEEDLPF